MKNAIPLIVAVALGLAAVFSVNRMLARSVARQEKSVEVLIANHDISPGANAFLSVSDVASVSIPKTAFIEGRHILASQKARIEGLPVSRRVSKDSHILWDDIDTGAGGQQVGKGEFLVDVRFQNTPLLSRLKPLDEIAIAAMQTIEETEQNGTDLNKAPVVHRVQRLTVLFPCVKVAAVSKDTVSISAPPEKALQLQMASLCFPLYPLLRRTGDPSNDSVGVGGSIASTDLSVEKLSLTH